MLYDPKWEKNYKLRTPSMADFIAWLETKNPNESYHFGACGGLCLAGQYMKACGVSWMDGEGEYRKFCKIIGGGVDWYSVPVLIDFPRTFGGALKRARALL